MTTYVIPVVSNRMTFALLAFLLLRYLGSFTSLAASKMGWVISFIAPLTFGIYLSHYLFVIVIMKVLNLVKCESPLIALGAILIVSIVIYLLCVGVIYVIRRIRYLRFLAP